MICSICGNELPDNAKFCAKCGTPTQDTNSPIQEVPFEPIIPAVEDTFVSAIEETVVVSPAPEQAPDAVFPVMPEFDIGPSMEDFTSTGAVVPPPTTEKVKKSSGGGSNYSGGGGGNGGKIALVIGAFLVVLALLGAVAFFFLGLGDDLFDSGSDKNEKSSSKKDKDDDKENGHSAPNMGFINSDTEEEEEEQESAQQEDAKKEEEESALSQNNPYYAVYTNTTDYVLPSDSQYCQPASLKNLSKEELVVALQEIYARHGQRTSDSLLQAYFDNRDWYTEKNAPAELNEFEKTNIYLISYQISQLDGSAAPASDNPYLPYLFTHGGQILKNSSTAQVPAATLSALTETELILAEAEIMARHGFFPTDAQLFAYFSCNANFTKTSSATTFNEGQLNTTEVANLQMIRLYLKKAQGNLYSPTNPFKSVDNQYGAYVIPYSSTQKLMFSDYSYMDLPTLCIARNEILARHGYTFTDPDLLEYFMAQDWYEPTSAPGDTSSLGLSTIENQNIMSIKEYENELKALGYTY